MHGEKIRALRVTTGKHMRELATSAGCSWRTLQMIETWGRQPGPELLHRILNELGKLLGRTVDIDEISSEVDQEQDRAA